MNEKRNYCLELDSSQAQLLIRLIDDETIEVLKSLNGLLNIGAQDIASIFDMELDQLRDVNAQLKKEIERHNANDVSS